MAKTEVAEGNKPIIFFCLKHGRFIEVTAKSPEGADGNRKVQSQAELIIEGSPDNIGAKREFRLPLRTHDENEINLLEKGKLYFVIMHNHVAIDDAVFVGKGEGKLHLFLVFRKNGIRFWIYRLSLRFTIRGKLRE